MIKKIIGIVFILMVLNACSLENNKQSENTHVSSIDTASSDSDKEAYYRQELENIRDKQQQYIDSLPENHQSSAQTVHSAILIKANELIQNHGTDQLMINRLVSELTTTNSEENIVDTNSIDTTEIIAMYAKEKLATYNEATPATIKKYYGLSVPEEVLSNIYLNDSQIAFIFYDLLMGEGTIYQLHACYVDEKGTELILFAKKDEQHIVFQTTSAPTAGRVSLDISQNEILNQYIQ